MRRATLQPAVTTRSLRRRNASLSRCQRGLPVAPRARRVVVRAAFGRKDKDDKQSDSGDLITNLVGRLFPSMMKDMQPAGLQRMTVEEWPDQWPAVTDQWAEPVEGDDETMEVLRPVLKQTMLEKVPLGLAYDASTHGWSTDAFHHQLDGMGAALLVAQTEAGTIFGGYNPKGWLGYGDWRDAISAFLFCWLDGDTSVPPMKMPKTGGSGMAIIDEPGKGPQWGPDGLKLDIAKRTAVSRLGPYYERRPDGGSSLFLKAEAKGAQLVALRVYVGLEETEKAQSYAPNMLQWQPGELEKIRENDNKGGK